MNERYLFSGKRKDDGTWICGDLISTRGKYCIHPNANSFEVNAYNLAKCVQMIEVDPETVGQCSGVPDKNGTLMYEGDIVNGMFDYEMKIKSICTFRNGSFGLLARQHGVEHFHPFTSLCHIRYKVIGNIYDDPNLCKLEHDSLCEIVTYKAGDEE